MYINEEKEFKYWKNKVFDWLECLLLGGGERYVWETHHVTLSRVQGFGFGIAVSGGRDSPHFPSGEPSIAITDVLKAGPAEGLLQINDRVIAVNSQSLENVDHAYAISLLKESGNTVNLVVRRKVLMGAMETEPEPLKITLNKKGKRDEYGIVLGCKLYIKEIVGNSLAAQEGGLKENDTILKINNTPAENLSLMEACKLLEKSKDRLQLLVTKGSKPDVRHKKQNSEPTNKDFNLRPKSENKNADLSPKLDNTDQGRVLPQQYTSNHGNMLPERQYNNASYQHLRDGSGSIAEEPPPPRPPLPNLAMSASEPPPRPPSPGKEIHPTYRPPSYTAPPSAEPRIPIRQHSFPEPRRVSFYKESSSVGIRLAGGNAVGIYIAAVQPGTPAYEEGLKEGDLLIQVNNVDMRGKTREEAALLLLSLETMINLTVQHRKEDYERFINSSEFGDSFYIRSHFNHSNTEEGHLSLTIGDVFHVTDTLNNGVVGSWHAVRIGKDNQETQKGVIPNKHVADQMSLVERKKVLTDDNQTKKGAFFRRKSGRRAKSLNKEQWEDMIFSNPVSTFPAYERVVLRQANFVRPVVIYGAIADVVRERLVKSNTRYSAPQADQEGNNPGVIKLGAIRDIMNEDNHALLDVTPNAVDRLNFAGYYPIVVYLRADSKNMIKQLRSKFSKGSPKSSKRLYEQSQRLENVYGHLFTGVIPLSATNEDWYEKVKEVIENSQSQAIWMSEEEVDTSNHDDYVLPMTANRLSFVSSPESDLDSVRPLSTSLAPESPYERKLMSRATSDPSLAAKGAPPYRSPPHHNPYITKSAMNVSFPNHAYSNNNYGRYSDNVFDQDDAGFYNPSFSHRSLSREDRSSIDPYTTLTPSERLRFQNQRPNGNPYQPRDIQQPQEYRNRPIVPPKPQVPYQHAQVYHVEAPAEWENKFVENKVNNETYSSSSDSYSKYTSNPANKHDDSKLREKFGVPGLKPAPARNSGSNQDAYKFTRSTSNPYNRSVSTIDRVKFNDLSRPKVAPKPAIRSKSETMLDPMRSDTSVRASRDDVIVQDDLKGKQRSMQNIDQPDGHRYRPLVAGDRYSGAPSSYNNTSYMDPYARQNSSIEADRMPRARSKSEGERRHRSGSDIRSHHSFGAPTKSAPAKTHETRRRSFTHRSNSRDRLPIDGAPMRPQSRVVGDDGELDGQTVVATARGVFDHNGGVLESKETGVSIHIPKGAIRTGVQQDIYFKVCQDNNILPPLDKTKGETLLSPLVMCGPHGLKFKIPVELRLPHSASMNPDSWSFSLKSSDSPSGHPTNWQNMTLAGLDGVAQGRVEKNSVSVMVDHF